MAEDDKVAKAQDEEEAGELENDKVSQQQEVEEAEESEKDKGANEQGEEDAEQSENEEVFPEQEVEETEESENDKGAKDRIEEDAEQLPNDKVTQEQETEETEELENGKGAKEQVEEDAGEVESDKVASQQRKEDVDESENEENTELDQEVDVDGETKQAPDVDEIGCSGAASAIKRTVAELGCETQVEPFVRRKSQRVAKRTASPVALGISQMSNANILISRSVRSPSHQQSVKSDEDGEARAALQQPCPEVGLTIQPPWCGLILDGSKVWEIRGSPCWKHVSKQVALIESKTNCIHGEVTYVACLPIGRWENDTLVPESDDANHVRDFVLYNQEKHRISYPAADPIIRKYKRLFAYVFEQPIRYHTPVPFEVSNRGAVTWMDLTHVTLGDAYSQTSISRC